MIKSFLRQIYQIFIYVIRNLSILKRFLFIFWQHINKQANYSGRKTIVFYQIYPSGWNSVKPIYESFLKNPNFRTIVLVSPNIKDVKESNNNCDAYSFYSSNINKENLVLSYNFATSEWFDLQALKPDFVFYNRPYNSEIPHKSFKSSLVASYAKVCFLHYGFSLSNEYSKFWANESFIYFASYIFSENDTKFNEYKRVLRMQDILGLVSIYNVGYPRFELLEDEKLKKNVRSVLWIPRWTSDNKNPDASSFLKLIWPILTFFENHPNLKLICRPHPKMIANLLSSGLLTNSEYDSIKKTINKLKNVSFDKNPDYLDSIRQSDLLLADYSALIADFFCTSKPIIYLGNSSHFNKEAANMAQSFYHTKDYSSAFSLILDLSKGNDPKKNKRKELSYEFNQKNYGSYLRIVNIIESSGEDFEEI